VGIHRSNRRARHAMRPPNFDTVLYKERNVSSTDSTVSVSCRGRHRQHRLPHVVLAVLR
jgi:hypothetical protein